uniref:TBK1 binding protein 1 n=1 Tax=Buteo japonicus TaxID=224669 RepID=A0A8C0AMK0_9AVES
MDSMFEDDISILTQEALGPDEDWLDSPNTDLSGEMCSASHFALITAYDDIKNRLTGLERENSTLKRRLKMYEVKVRSLGGTGIFGEGGGGAGRIHAGIPGGCDRVAAAPSLPRVPGGSLDNPPHAFPPLIHFILHKAQPHRGRVPLLPVPLVNLALAYTELTEELCRLRNLSSLQSQILRALLQEKSLNGGKEGGRASLPRSIPPQGSPRPHPRIHLGCTWVIRDISRAAELTGGYFLCSPSIPFCFAGQRHSPLSQCHSPAQQRRSPAPQCPSEPPTTTTTVQAGRASVSPFLTGCAASEFAPGGGRVAGRNGGGPRPPGEGGGGLDTALCPPQLLLETVDSEVRSCPLCQLAFPIGYPDDALVKHIDSHLENSKI